MKQRIADAATIIFLTKSGHLEFLRLNADEVLAPVEVLEETQAKQDEAATELQRHPGRWLKKCSLSRPELMRLLPDMDKGERSVLAQAIQEGIESVVLDDMEARRIARRISLKPIGTVGLLIAARQKGLVTSLKVELERLKALGFWLSDELYESV